MEIDFKEYDEISKMEKIIEGIIDSFDIKNACIILTTPEQQLIYILTMISILYKERCYEEYLSENVNGMLDDISIELIDEIIGQLEQQISENKIMDTTYTIKKYGQLIEGYLQRYFFKKNTNYISNKHSMEIIKSKNKQKEILKHNPLIINQLLQYEQKPLSKEEIIIQEITEFLVEAQQLYENEEEIINNIKDLMKRNYKKDRLNEAIMFIISNVYQEIIEHPEDENINIIVSIVENTNIKPEQIIEHFKKSKAFSNMLLQTFIKYNLNIEEKRLEELENKPSKEYAKRIYTK